MYMMKNMSLAVNSNLSTIIPYVYAWLCYTEVYFQPGLFTQKHQSYNLRFIATVNIFREISSKTTSV